MYTVDRYSGQSSYDWVVSDVHLNLLCKPEI
jgi:hypothetical protein